MGQRIELIKELGILSADVKWFHGMDPDGKPCNIKSRFKASEKLNALLYRESEIKTFLDVDSVITASRTFLDGEYTLSLFPVLDGFVPFHQVIEQEPELQTCIKTAISLAGVIKELHAINVVSGLLDPDALYYHPELDKFVTINSWNLAIEGEYSSQVLSDLQEFANLITISPEATGRTGRRPDKFSDLYSLGVLFYKVFTGKYPFNTQDPVSLVHAHIAKAPEFDPGLAYSTPEVILGIIEKLLDKEPQNRYPDIETLLRDLNECLEQYEQTGEIQSFAIARQAQNSRLTFPEFLYGREAEVNHLNDLYIRFLNTHNSQVTAVCGPSGIGKSALINELRLPVTENNGMFAVAKCEQFNQSASYSVIVQALRTLLEQFLLLDEDILSRLKKDLSEASSIQLARLLPLIPELETIIGELQKTEDMHRERLEKSCVALLEILTRQKPNIVLVLDDMQWIDKLTMGVLGWLARQIRLPKIFIIFVYRDTEITENHPLTGFLQEIQGSRFNIDFIQLGLLSAQSTQDFVEDTFWETDFNLEDLGKIVVDKTQGNPFFVREFLQNVTSQKNLYENEEGVWSWQEEKIRATHVTENVTDLIAIRLARLPEKDAECLKFASFLDDQIDISLLQSLIAWPKELMYSRLGVWESEGILVAASENGGKSRYYFSHNKVRQAVRQLETGPSADDICYSIARLLMNQQDEQWLSDNALDLVQYIHPSLESHKAEHNLEELARFYQLAGISARSKLAKEIALEYFRTGASLIGPQTWENNHDLGFDLYEGLAECLFDCQLEDEFEDVLRLLQSKASSSHHEIRLVRLRVRLAIFLEQLQKAHELYIDFIAQTYPDLALPESLKDYLEIEEYYPSGGVAAIDIAFSSTVRDEMLIQELMAEVIPGAKTLGNIPYYQVVYVNLWLALRYGNHAVAVRGYVNHALILAGITTRFSESMAFVKLAENCHERYLGTPQIICELNYIKHAAILPWTHSVRKSIQPLYDNFQLGLKHTNIDFSWDSCVYSGIYRFLIGEPLEQVIEQFNDSEHILREKGQIFYYRLLNLWQQLASNLNQAPDGVPKFEGEHFSHSVDLPKLLASNSHESLFCYHFCRLQLNYYFDDFDTGLRHWLAGKQLINNISPYAYVPDFYAFGGLILLKHLRQNKTSEEKATLLQEIKNIVRFFRNWAEQCPANFAAKLALLEAELATFDQTELAWKAFSQAISLADEYADTHWLAVSHELYANYWVNNDELSLAESHFRKAIVNYKEWQANAKVAHLLTRLSRFNFAFHDLNLDYADSSEMPVVSENNLDLLSVLKAAETLSGSIDLEAFLNRMMNIIIENAGAQKGCIIFEEDGQFRVRGSYPEPMELEQIPETLLNYVIRTKEPYAVHDSAAESKLNLGLKSFGRLPNSLLITPLIVASHLRGLLYLEHRELKGFFTADRIDVLQLLANQTAILFDNASLNKRLLQNNRNLELKVEQRTEELARAKLKAEEATAAKSNFLANMSHEIRTPMNAVIGLSRLALKKQINPVQRDYLEKILSSSESLLTLINDILDFSKIEAQKLTLEAIPFRLEECLRRVVNLHNHKMHEKRLEFVLSVDSEIPDKLIGDPLRIEQIIVNLVSNAIKFTEQGYVHLSILLLKNDPSNHYSSGQIPLEIRVKDSGIGMNSEQTSRLFTSFSQADDSVTRKYGGTGLGLAICKQLSELMDGGISVHSEPELGSEFVVRLVIQESSDAMIYDDIPDMTNLKALVVDDVEVARDVVRENLTVLGIQVETASDGKAAVELVMDSEVKQHPFDIILMDWKMPGMDGIETIRKIQHLVDGSIPHILMITSYDKEEIKGAASTSMVAGFIEKPVSQSALVESIQSALGITQSSNPNGFTAGDIPELSESSILLVEDNELNQQVAMEFLKDTGADIALATDGKKAVAAAKEHHFDLILMDIQMPEMDGLQATAEIRKFNQHTPIVAMTAHAMEGDRERSLEAGMNGHITKPIQPAELYKVICSFVLQLTDDSENLFATTKMSSPSDGSISYGLQAMHEIAALNVDKAIERFQGRAKLYLELVDDFSKEYANVPTELHHAHQNGKHEIFYRKVHSLKSNAAYIGAFELSGLLAELESRLQNEDNINDIFPIVILKIEELLLELSEKQMLREKYSMESASEEPVECEEINLRSLLPLLQNSNFKVESSISLLKSRLSNQMVINMLSVIENLVGELEFEEASDYLSEWLEQHENNIEIT